MKSFALNKHALVGWPRKILVCLLCCCLLVCSLAGCSSDIEVKRKEFITSTEKTITPVLITEGQVREELISPICFDEETITEEGLHQYYYSGRLICEAYIFEITVGTTSVEEIYEELNAVFGVEINWKLSLAEFAIGTTLVIVAGVVGGILGPSTYFVSFSAAEVLKTALSGGIINSIINVFSNGIKEDGLSHESFVKYAIEGFSEGYMYAAFCNVAETALKNVVRYIRYNAEYGQSYSIGYDGSVYDMSGKRVGTGYYQDDRIVVNKFYDKVDDGINARSKYPADSRLITADGDVCYTDSAGKIYRIGDDLIPNTSYTINNAKYQTDIKGRISKVEFSHLTVKAEDRGRRTIIGNIDDIGKGDAIKGDERGHLLADMFDGDNTLANIVPMSYKANHSDVKKVELLWKQSVLEGNDVSGSIKLNYKGNSYRPTSFIYSYSINGGEEVVEEILN